MIAGSVREGLAQVETLLREELNPDQPWLAALLGDVARMGGKRVRPLMTLLFGDLAGGISDRHIPAAVAFEMVHVATLVHDDILDGAEIRRNQPALHRVHGDHSAVLAGDYLFTRAFSVANRCGCVGVLNELARASSEVCSGEIRQNFSAGDWQLSLADYEAIVAAKTASLCQGACRSGVLLANSTPPDSGRAQALRSPGKTESPDSGRAQALRSPGKTADQIDAAGRYGAHLGVAFQVIDDCLDLTGHEELTGKTLGTDAERGKLTYPLIHALAVGGAESRLLKECLMSGDPEGSSEIAQLVMRLGGVQAAHDFAAGQLKAAVDALSVFPDGDSKTALVRLAEFVGCRQR